MGNIETRFHQLLLSGDLEQAVLMWSENVELQSKLDLKSPVRYSPQKDPPLHCILRVGNYRVPQLKVLVYEFIDKGADPLYLNASSETAIHVVCCSQRHSARVSKARCEVLEVMLDKLPSDAPPPKKNGVNDGTPTAKRGHRCFTSLLNMVDKSRNTPLHLAAASGLLDCVELLLACGAPLFSMNVAKQTPLDSAVAAKQMIIAPILESQMVLMENKEPSPSVVIRQKSKSFYTPEQLKEVQMGIVSSVSEMYKVSFDNARALLSAYSWSKELLDEAWTKDKEEACSKAGLDPNNLESPHEERFVSLSMKQCEICYEHIVPGDLVDVPCGHYFCRECWASYLEVSVKEGGGKDVCCPGHDCSRPVPLDIVARLISKELYRKYSDLNLQHFVDLNQDIKWCPYPDCGQAVVKREGRVTKPVLGKRHGINVECGNGHGFCWNCLKDAHEPCECEVWQKWLEVITKMAGDSDRDMVEVAAQAEADALWIISNTKPCPRCEAPIQKNEGCNHMTCRKCSYDFCWVCLDPWSDHSYRTGGYFSCNRFNAQRKANNRVNDARKTMTKAYRSNATEDFERQNQKFTHYHERYRNHLLSIKIECQILAQSQAKTRSLMSMGKVVEKKVAYMRGTAPEQQSKPQNVGETENFLEGIMRVLLQARRLLATSYGIGFMILDERKEAKEAHETIQGKLEEVVEMLAQMVSRPYLNTPRADMSETARNVEYINTELTEVLREVLVTGLEEEPPLPPPPRPRGDILEVEFEVDPLVLFAHLALRHDPQFREIFNQLVAEQGGLEVEEPSSQ